MRMWIKINTFYSPAVIKNSIPLKQFGYGFLRNSVAQKQGCEARSEAKSKYAGIYIYNR